jgi:hypothetical protein
MQKERPILFSTPMVQALLAGTKTMTRRVVNPQPIIASDGAFHYKGEGVFINKMITKCPYGKVGDLLWVRETFKPKFIKGCLSPFKLNYPNIHPWFYAADNENTEGYGSWKPSIHMPKAAARIWLEITNLRVERLQDITQSDAKSEGIKSCIMPGHNAFTKSWTQYYDYNSNKFHQFAQNYPIQSFQSLWLSINGEESWNANPWVWVVEFKKINK